MATERPGSKQAERPADASLDGLPEDGLSRAALLELFGEDEDLLRELVGLFLEDSPALLNDLRAGVAGQDAVKVERAAHSLKGSVGNFGATRLAELARRLEAMGRARDLDSAPDALTALEQELARISARLGEIAREESP
jgi:two-component system sensor histidine kinase/response regulator